MHIYQLSHSLNTPNASSLEFPLAPEFIVEE